MKRNDGGPAFPVKEYLDAKPGALTWGEHPGMTLRDYFAGQALAGTLADSKVNPMSYDGLARFSYKCADAMLAEREKLE